VPPGVTARNLAGVAGALRTELEALEAIRREIDGSEQARAHPHAPYWHLTLDFGLDFLHMALGWLAKAQRVVARPPRRTSSRSRSSR
jgi:hypothetical protein